LLTSLRNMLSGLPIEMWFVYRPDRVFAAGTNSPMQLLTGHFSERLGLDTIFRHNTRK
jgi:hypothetical protein